MRENLPHLETFSTEQQNPNSHNIDMKTTAEILQIINDEDRAIPGAVKKELPAITKVVDKVVETFRKKGRLFYVGAGTSGRLGMLDASECPSTFGTDPEMVQGIIAGGNEALTKTVEWIEDNEAHGEKVIIDRGITSRDIVIGISASGYAPFVIGAMKQAKKIGATVAFLSCNASKNDFSCSDLKITIDVGPEIIAGSTRMKSGTAQKMVLNMITTASMIKLGKVYNNLMVDLRPVNSKLIQRSIRIIKLATSCDDETARQIFMKSGKKPKTAILMILLDIKNHEADSLLSECDGLISMAVRKFKERR